MEGDEFACCFLCSKLLGFLSIKARTKLWAYIAGYIIIKDDLKHLNIIINDEVLFL